MGKRAAIYVPFPQAVPLKYTIDPDACLYLTRGTCGKTFKCKDACPADAIDFEMQEELIQRDVQAVIVAIGFDAVVGFEALKMKYLHGFASYIVAALKTIFLYFKAPQVQIDYDGKCITLPALMVSIMNGRRMGGGFMMAPDGHADDGLLDLIVAREVSRPKIFALIARFPSTISLIRRGGTLISFAKRYCVRLRGFRNSSNCFC